MGDRPSTAREVTREAVKLDTFGGTVHVEWDAEAAATPLGHLAFFAEYLKVSGRFDALVADCPLHYTSPNAPSKRDPTDLIEGRLSSADGRAALVKLATRLIVEEALEAESRDALGRDYYEHGASPGQGWRNGVRMGRLKTAEGLVDYAAPQIAGREETFRSEIRESLKGHTQALEDLAVELLARGLSVRDIEDAFRDESGRLLLSRTAVSEIGERLWADYQEFATRDPGEYDGAYLFVDGIAERIRPGQRRRAGTGGLGLHGDRAKALLHLMAGSKEDAETVSAFFQNMRTRGLGDPLLMVSDGAAGIIKVIETCFPRSARQRCLAHRMRNLAAKVPEDLWPEFKARTTAAYQAPSRAIARDLASGVVADYQVELPSASACFEDDFEACIAHLRMPITGPSEVMIVFGVTATRNQLCPSRSIREAPSSRFSMTAPMTSRANSFVASRTRNSTSSGASGRGSERSSSRHSASTRAAASTTRGGRPERSMDEGAGGGDTGMGMLPMLGFETRHRTASGGAERSHLPLLDPAVVTNGHGRRVRPPRSMKVGRLG